MSSPGWTRQSKKECCDRTGSRKVLGRVLINPDDKARLFEYPLLPQ